MKNMFLGLAASFLIVACNSLAENEYEIKGNVDPSLNGKKVFLQKQGGMGYVATDTAVVENGTFIFKDTISEPEMRFIAIEDKEPGNVVDFILEPGSIKIETDKDILHNSKRYGTYNNEKLEEYYSINKGFTEELKEFQKKKQAAYMQAMQTKDTAAVNNLMKEEEVFRKRSEDLNIKFIKENPKAYINLFFVGNLVNSPNHPFDEVKKLYNSLDKDLLNTKMGKKLSEFIDKKEQDLNAQKQSEENKKNVEVGKTAPSFSAPTPEGKTMSLKDAMGKVTIIDFWASWCVPCRNENPNVVAMYKELHPKGLNIIGVSLDKDGEKWKEAIAKDNLTWNHVSNLQFWQDPIARQYGVEGIPATFVLDENGVIVARDLRGEELKAKVKELLAK
ncbi:redoxin domain-containing protein [Flavobacterium rhizosphaerae]|uniref:TlpA disulfide reductase family protein n=1 Tax=Flavobacterium rhizosphaerae TaxID=3163298 RepID=A0ABW8YVR5_9FLAO